MSEFPLRRPCAPRRRPSTEFDLFFSDGNVNRGTDEVGGRMIFQPFMPIPLYGEGKDEWKLITRPTLPILFSQPLPAGFD